MSGPNTDRTETRRSVRRGERTIDVRLITYPGGTRRAGRQGALSGGSASARTRISPAAER
jgi:hypothetical protein